MTDASFDPATAGWEVVPNGGFVALIGPVWRKRADHGLLFGLKVEERHSNRGGFIHGGALAALLDTALGQTSSEAIGRRDQATVTLDIQYLAPVPIGAFLTVAPEVVKTTRSLTFLRGIARIDEDVCAIAQGTWKILRA